MRAHCDASNVELGCVGWQSRDSSWAWLRVVVPVFASFGIGVDVEFGVEWELIVGYLIVLVALGMPEAVFYGHRLQGCYDFIDRIPVGG
jgi:hypothetical protein